MADDPGGGLMGYVQAGYSIVLAILFLYAVSLLVRRRRLDRAVARLTDPPHAEGQPPLRSCRSGGRRRVSRRRPDGRPARQEPARTGPDVRGRA